MENNNTLSQPKSLRILFLTEMWERFSYYGMRALLVLYLVQSQGYSAFEAMHIYAIYTGLVYLTPVIGGYLADHYLGQQKSILNGFSVCSFDTIITIDDDYKYPLYDINSLYIQFKKNDQGFYAMANGGLTTLIYASWTDNKKLAAKEINHTFKEIDKLFYEDGYINNNSFRGVRGQWYHSYGVDIALGYVYVANLWGATVPKNIHDKLINSANLVNLAITDPVKFKSRKFKE